MLMDLITNAGLLVMALALVGFIANSIWKQRGRAAVIGAGVLIVMAVGGFLMAGINGIVFYARPGMSYLVQYPWGTQSAVLSPGFHTRFFGEAIPFKKFLTVSFGEDHGEFSGTAPPQMIRFNDSVTAQVRMTARFELPSAGEQFLPMAVAYRSQENLINSSLVPIMQEAMRNAGRMFSAQEYIGGRGGDFENAVLDQVRNGIFLLDITEERSYAGAAKVTEAAAREVQQDQTVRVTVQIRRDENGTELRKDAEDHPLKKFGIKLVQANVQDVDPDPVFKDKLKEQREAAAQVAIERQNARKEEERKKRIIAQGEAEKAEKKIELEKAQIEKVIAAETKAKEAEQEQARRVTEATTRKREAEIEKERKEVELQTARLEAERIETLARAEADRRRLLMEADNALEKRLEAFVEVSRVYAAAITDKRLVPEVVIAGAGQTEGGSSNATDLIALLTAKAARDLGVAVSESDRAAAEMQEPGHGPAPGN
jgi:regulator of protease activity HflC (stomatin/prohibitin superfamily)